MMDGLTIVTLSLTAPHLFRRMAASLPTHVAIADRILVDQGPGCPETVREALARGWYFISPPENLSFAAGNNLAARAAHTSHLWLLNNDAEVLPGCVDALWNAACAGYALIGCVIETSAGVLNHAGGMFTQDGWPEHFGRGDSRDAVRDDRAWPWCTFASVVIRADLYRQLGGLDEGFVYSFEDVDACLRAREQGGHLAFIPHRARIRHNELGTRTGKEDAQNAARYAQRWLATGRFARAMAAPHVAVAR
jgi:GT2 family glycosyltransferase